MERMSSPCGGTADRVVIFYPNLLSQSVSIIPLAADKSPVVVTGHERLGADVPLPSWNDPDLKAGTMVRGALWLLTDIGEGNTFTKEDVRTAFPGVAQADRRIRDLRKYGWVIRASTEDATLSTEEQRFVSPGVEVWLPKARQAVKPGALTAKQRRDIMAADGYQCTACGIAGGETYQDSVLMTAVLSITRRSVMLLDGSSEVQAVTECNRCRAGEITPIAVDFPRLVADLRELGDEDFTRLVRWTQRNRRGATPLDRAWTTYRRMPNEKRRDFEDALMSERQRRGTR